MKLTAIAMVLAALGLAACGGSSGGDHATTAAGATRTGTGGGGPGPSKAEAKLPPGAVGPVDTAEEAAEGPAATEASPEAPANGPRSTGSLPDADSAAVSAVVRSYVAALDGHDAGSVCSLIAPGGLPVSDLPKRRGGCRPSLRASIGTRPTNGGPAWRSTEIVELKPEAVGGDRARVTATVTHHFSDRKYVSVEDDVIYLERAGARWLLAKPSATLYRAVGYAQPPLRAFSPPAGW
jgi:hypothetical protein